MNSIDDAIKDASENGLADDDANLMIKMKFLPYKVFFLLRIESFVIVYTLLPLSLYCYHNAAHVFNYLTVENLSDPQWPISSI